ncbi:DNA-processing protein DprA [Staphylococcus canis]|uniref:DNA-protecting protein DprA n=1 Tax=Staphylococcus canis TaxID=2724942 RepID=A0ABS0T812_9STAP|nr:DNA-processing protein DprA [Staphylococcus canis]MBI5974890.1 DNA-protecting protein DprA [Staphylococcus canis]
MQKILLLLLYAGFTTQQIQKIETYCPDLFKSPYTLTHIEKVRQRFSQNIHFQKKFDKLITLNYNQIRNDLRNHEIKIVDVTQSNYPQLLKQIYDAPYILFCKGDISLLDKTSRMLSIVGARAHTSYTNECLEELFPYFKTQQLVIVSGLAHGTDALAHQYALSYDLPTIAVLGFGHAYHYPQTTKLLRDQIERTSLTISEYPPTTPPAKFRFPERNRIISGISKGLFVTEAKERSGALITMDQALEQNRNVYVLPGRMFDVHTRGNLIRAKEGAEIVLNAFDILKDYE